MIPRERWSGKGREWKSFISKVCAICRLRRSRVSYHPECFVSNPGPGCLISHSSSSSLAVSSSLPNASSVDFVLVTPSPFCALFFTKGNDLGGGRVLLSALLGFG